MTITHRTYPAFPHETESEFEERAAAQAGVPLEGARPDDADDDLEPVCCPDPTTAARALCACWI